LETGAVNDRSVHHKDAIVGKNMRAGDGIPNVTHRHNQCSKKKFCIGSRLPSDGLSFGAAATRHATSQKIACRLLTQKRNSQTCPAVDAAASPMECSQSGF